MSLLTDKDILDILEPVTDPALVAKLRDNAEDLAIFMSEYSVVAQASQAVTLKAVAEWLKGRSTDHETPNYPGRFITPRYNCDRCIQKLMRLGSKGKMPGEEK